MPNQQPTPHPLKIENSINITTNGLNSLAWYRHTLCVVKPCSSAYVDHMLKK